MGAFVEEFSEKRDEVSLEDDFLEASWSRYHADIAAVQRDIHLLRSEVTHRLTALVREEQEREPASHGSVSGWLRQRIRALEINLDAMFLWRMRECAFKRAKRAQAIRKFCDGKGELERSS
ncbi:hypothetical protein HYS30_01600 [Candidatus Peregrinibacteria bacterium]|nr:hypothetical protein [Candidatus Peregrinibacteria bacterium]